MRFVSLRRTVIACLTAAAVLALGMTGVASATKLPPPEPDTNAPCTGAATTGEGSTFQGPAEFKWTGFNTETLVEGETGFNHGTNPAHCLGGPKVKYEQKVSDSRGSGSCLKTWGRSITVFGEELGGIKYPRLNTYPWCGTDEAPTEAAKVEMEGFAEGEFEPGDETAAEHGDAQSGEAIETIPIGQGSESIDVHLPKDCVAKSKVEDAKGKKATLGRLALDSKSLEGIYRGTIKTWKALLETQPFSHGENELECTEGGENDTITPVVRRDGSGTTHIFKAWLAQVFTGEWGAEAFEKINGSEEPCKGKGGLEEGHKVTWEQVSEGCENQRWPLAAKVFRPSVSGNQGVILAVHEKESSVGYTDIAVNEQAGYNYFVAKEINAGGENGGEQKGGEQNKQFWAVIQDSEEGAGKTTYADPSSKGFKGDTEKAAESNCKYTKYVAKVGDEFPPRTTRKDWSKVKAEAVSQSYGICGLTYVVAARQYYPLLKKYGVSKEASLKIAQTVHDYLAWVTNKKGTGGQKELKKSFYSGLPKQVQKEAEYGALEIGSEKG
jgi:ABC-type phosphate transport system substrate-binding protein